MSTEIKVPQLGESVSEATIAKWFKKVGDSVAVDEPLVELETDKVTVEVPSPVAGALEEIIAQQGDDVEVGALLATLAEGAAGAAVSKAPAKAEARKEALKAAAPAPAKEAPKPAAAAAATSSIAADHPLAPSVRRLVDEHNLDPKTIPATGKNGRLTKGDVLQYVASGGEGMTAPTVPDRGPREERVKMTRLRRRIADRLKGSAEHRSHADHLQRSGHERGDERPQAIPRRFC